MKGYRFILCMGLILGAFFPLFADYNHLGVPDSSDVRRTLIDSWFLAPLELVQENKSERRQNSIGQEFQVRCEEQDAVFSIIVAPQVFLDVDVYTENGVEHQRSAEYPSDVSGSWILTRDMETGKPISIRLYFAQDSDVYVQFSTDGKKTTADYVVAGCYAARSVPVGISFDSLYALSFSGILALTEKTLPWKYADIHTDGYHSNLQMIGVIKKNLSSISYADDAAYDENGNPVYISTGKPRAVDEAQKNTDKLSLSSAGFVKWIIDGLIEPQSGSYTLLAPLTHRTVNYKAQGYNGIRSESDDMSFTLDWTRNLASAWLSVRTGKNYLYDDSGVDVTITPFSAELTENGIRQTAGYIKDTGYTIEKIRALLYVLAVTEPTYCYLAAIRRCDPAVPGLHPEAYVFDRAAVLFPYFDSTGRFGCIVFENGSEIPFNTFVKKYKGSYIHLTRVLTTDQFFPQ